MSKLFDGFDLHGLSLPNRMAMSPMTRTRATEDAVPTDVMREYYVQRASAGLLVIANPDLVKRYRLDAPLNKPDPSTFYGIGSKGYTDCPTVRPLPIEYFVLLRFPSPCPPLMF